MRILPGPLGCNGLGADLSGQPVLRLAASGLLSHRPYHCLAQRFSVGVDVLADGTGGQIKDRPTMIGVKDYLREVLVGLYGEREPVYDQNPVSFFLFDLTIQTFRYPRYTRPNSECPLLPLSIRIKPEDTAGDRRIIPKKLRNYIAIYCAEKFIGI